MPGTLIVPKNYICVLVQVMLFAVTCLTGKPHTKTTKVTVITFNYLIFHLSFIHKLLVHSNDKSEMIVDAAIQ